MNLKRTIVIVLRSGGDFAFRDVELIVRHITTKWKSAFRPHIVCLWDGASQPYDLGNFEILPLVTDEQGTWSRIMLYSPEMEKYRPFLYVDLDTAIITTLEDIFELVQDPSMFVTLEDFYQKGQLATGLVWVPANSDKVQNIWNEYKKGVMQGWRMDYFLRKVVRPDAYWQQFTQGIVDFKPQGGKLLTVLPNNAILVCFHGKPRIFTAGTGSLKINWVSDYINLPYSLSTEENVKATVIISYKEDRGWLNEAIASVPEGVQLILSKGDNSWSKDFNRALPMARGKYIKYLHEDDMLTPNCIDDSIAAIDELGVDCIHGNVIELIQKNGKRVMWKPSVQIPTLKSLLKENTCHSASMMYRREVFEQLGGLDEELNTSEDYEFNLKCLHAGLKIGYCPKVLAIYRRHDRQKVRMTEPREQRMKRDMIRKRYSV